MNNIISKSILSVLGFALTIWWQAPAFAHTTHYTLSLTCMTNCATETNPSDGDGLFDTTMPADPNQALQDIPVDTNSISITYTSENFEGPTKTHSFIHASNSPVAGAVSGNVDNVNNFNLSVSGFEMTLTRLNASAKGGSYTVEVSTTTSESGTYTVTAIPEPSTLSIFVAGLVALGTVARKNRQKSKIQH